MKLMYVVGARPNFVKVAPVMAEMRRRRPGEPDTLVHTGQHYDDLMSDVLLEELGVGRPDHLLGVGSASHAVQTARVMERIEPVLALERPDLVIVPGDVNSTLAVTLVAAKLGIRLAHLEAGLRSFDRTMPEEVNRIVADEFSDLLFVHCDDAVENLGREGISAERIHFVGNTMIDSLVAVEERFRAAACAARLGLRPGDFLLVTLHRPGLVDGPLLAEVMDALEAVARVMPVIFPVHPRTRKMLGGDRVRPGLRLCPPLGYLDFLSLEADAAGVLTDSGGVQEEAPSLGKPVLVMRDTTERPEGVAAGTAFLTGPHAPAIVEHATRLLTDEAAYCSMASARNPYGDGYAAERIVERIRRYFAAQGAPSEAFDWGKADRMKQDHRVTQLTWGAREGGEMLTAVPRPYRAGAAAT
jgi:UDP-N-acetylglucosamine 2-epimerase (non-hydrolysing)